jgi:bifunctional non-homologous end joining protein LigD
MRSANRWRPSSTPPNAILDGEVIAADENGRPQFYDVIRRTRPPAYIAFDILWLDGTDLRRLPLTERRRLLPTTTIQIFYLRNHR